MNADKAQPLEVLIFHCKEPLCSFCGETINQLVEHRLASHSFDTKLITSNGSHTGYIHDSLLFNKAHSLEKDTKDETDIDNS